MSTDHTAALIVGFSIAHDDLGTPFKTTLPEESHLEDRFNARTGVKLQPVKVVDADEREAYLFEGVTYAELEELVEAMEQHVKCRINSHGDFFNGDLEYSIQPTATAGKSFLGFEEVAALKIECLRIKRAFEKYGIELGEPTVFALSSVM
jgi:hypothetical protein